VWLIERPSCGCDKSFVSPKKWYDKTQKSKK
jgi:hypothetical protein